MVASKTTKIVGSPAIKDNFAITVHGEQVVYTGTVKGAVMAAVNLIGAVVIVTPLAKTALDRDMERQQKKIPHA